MLKAIYNKKIFFFYSLNRMRRKLPKKLQKMVTMTKKEKDLKPPQNTKTRRAT